MNKLVPNIDEEKCTPPQANDKELEAQIDAVIFRCFAQGQHWGTELDGKLNPDYKPEEPISRDEAVTDIMALIHKDRAAVQHEAEQKLDALYTRTETANPPKNSKPNRDTGTQG